MLIINRQQRAALAVAVMKNIEDDLLRRERLRSPHGVDGLGDEEALRACIRLAFAKADGDGFTSRAGAIAYVQAVLDCGLGFATDPMHRWAAPALQSNRQAAERWLLLPRAMASAAPPFTLVEWRRADSAVGYLREILERAAAGILDDLPVLVLRHLAMDVRRVRGLDKAGRERLFEVADGMAQHHGLSGHLGTSVFLLALVLFGHECASDPRYRWLGNIELSPADHQPTHRLRTLLDVCRRHIADQISAAASEPPTNTLPVRVLPTGQQFLSIGLGAELPSQGELPASRPQA
jgi:hypothetical protein